MAAHDLSMPLGVHGIIMFLTQLRIHGYRGFKSQGILDLAVPNGSAGSGLTILTGPNNGGKSSILECLRARSGTQAPSFPDGTRHRDVELVEVIYVVDGIEQVLRSISKGSSETIRINFTGDPSVFVVPSRKTFSPYFGKSAWSREQFVSNSPLPAQRSAVLTGFEYRLFSIHNEPSRFNAILSRVLGYEPEWTIDLSPQGQHYLKFFNGDHSHSSDGMGDGLISIFAIVDSLYDSSPGSLIAIDEPELSLNPTLQKRTAALIEEYASDRQIVIATHSPYFVSLTALAAGGNLARVVTDNNGSMIHQLSIESKSAIGRLSQGNLYNPHIFGLDARELFFQEERIILTEGQEDVLLFPSIADQLGTTIQGNFFGWGVGGAGNIGHLCRILQDLGFKKVAALLDGDKVGEATSLEKTFPAYLFRCIPAKDIRTKPARGETASVDGLLDEDRTIKDKYREATAEIFGALAQHLDA